MNNTNTSLHGIIIAFIIVILLFVPIPTIGKFVCLWILFLVICNLICGNPLFSLFISTVFVALFAMYLGPSIKQQNVENFEPEVETDIASEPVDKPIEKPTEKTNLDDIMNQISASVSSGDVSGGGDGGDSGGGGGDSEKNKEIEDFFGKLDVGNYEDSDDDSDEDANEDKLEKKVGKTTTSSKKAYKAQKQLYDLNVTANALNMTITKMAPTLQKGQKIIEKLKGLGIEKYL